jgi:hypothetical protein
MLGTHPPHGMSGLKRPDLVGPIVTRYAVFSVPTDPVVIVESNLRRARGSSHHPGDRYSTITEMTYSVHCNQALTH